MADYRYSPALKRSGITWTAEALDTFIADPQASVPANRMPYAGMPDAGDRADLIAYLQKSYAVGCAGPRCLNSAAWSFTKSRMFVGASPVSLHMVSVMRS